MWLFFGFGKKEKDVEVGDGRDWGLDGEWARFLNCLLSNILSVMD